MKKLWSHKLGSHLVKAKFRWNAIVFSSAFPNFSLPPLEHISTSWTKPSKVMKGLKAHFNGVEVRLFFEFWAQGIPKPTTSAVVDQSHCGRFLKCRYDCRWVSKYGKYQKPASQNRQTNEMWESAIKKRYKAAKLFWVLLWRGIAEACFVLFEKISCALQARNYGETLSRYGKSLSTLP